jgi:hypothetical protein
MDMEKIRVRQDLSRMVINYYLRGNITEGQSALICDYIDSAIGGGNLPQPGRGRQGRAVIPFPTTYTGPKESDDGKPKQEEPQEKAPEINAPYGEPLPEGVQDFRETLQRAGLILICYQKLVGREGTFYDVLWAQSGTRMRCTNWSGAVREEDLPYVLPLDGVIDNYKYRDFRVALKTAYTVNVAPENVLNGPLAGFFAYIQSLKDAGMKNDFDYVYIFAAEKRNRFLIKNKELVDLKIPARVLSSLDEREIHTIKDLQRLTVKDLLKIKYLGPAIVNDTIAVLKKAGITLQDEGEEKHEYRLRQI